MPRLPDVIQFLSSAGKRIYRIPCQAFSAFTARVYLVLGAGPPTLIDTGSGQGESCQNILDGIDTVRREFGESVRIKDVRRIVITHGHSDHYGGLSAVLARTDAEVCIHPLDAGRLTACRESAVVALRNLRRLLVEAGTPPEVTAEFLSHHGQSSEPIPSVPVNVERLACDEMDGLRVLHTPGHSPGHVCLVADDLLLCGDHILARTIPQLWPESLRPYQGLGHYLDSLRNVRAIPRIRIALPGHEPIIEGLYERIDAIERFQSRRIAQIADLVRAASQPMTIWDIAGSVYPRTGGFFALLAFLDTAARVEYLHCRGRLRLANLDRIEADQHAAWAYETA
ncbi:MAG TPA: MBL fold metallo-hydrolase [Planctomycetaceae bacterium]|nr:MBL fold metallo-hydrolase [Planctomycetaceae bacterium]